MMRYLRKLCTKDSKGFALMQVALGVGFFSIVAASSLALYRVKIKQQRVETTITRLNEIRAAMARYYAQHGELPCPAPTNVPPNSALFGKSDTINCATGAAQAGTTRTDPALGPTVRIGSVPVVALGLPLEYTIDSWGNRFVFGVTESMAEDGTPPGAGAITLLGTGASVLKSNVPYVVLSPSQNGVGTVNYDGVPNSAACPAIGSSPIAENCSNTATFRSQPFSLAEAPADRFDQLVGNTLVADGKAAACGKLGMLYGPKHPLANQNVNAPNYGCVPSMVVDPGTGNVSFGLIVAGQEAITAAMDVRGEIKFRISNPVLACTAATGGAMRYSPAPTNLLEYCDGTALTWKTLQGPQGFRGERGDHGPTGPAGADGVRGPQGLDCPYVEPVQPPPNVGHGPGGEGNGGDF